MQPENYYVRNLPTLSTINRALIIVCAAIFVLQSILTLFFDSHVLTHFLGLSKNMFLQGHLYQIFTYPFPQNDLLSFVFNALILWFIGSEIERSWGSLLYLGMLLTATVAAALCYLLVITCFFSSDQAITALPMLGITGICSALLLIYSLFYGERILSFMLIFPMKAKYFCWLLLAMEFYFGIFSYYAKSSWGHLGAMLGAFLFLKFGLKSYLLLCKVLSKIYFKRSRPSFRSRPSSCRPEERLNLFRDTSHLRLLKNEEDDSNGSNDINETNGKGKDKGTKYWQ
ncbi:MAG: rhomboid family intramembrane serine protease [Oligoflexia bacterium]|nr:rhomboid family intramembrane serine protease [Oligoflexia bacterium]